MILLLLLSFCAASVNDTILYLKSLEVEIRDGNIQNSILVYNHLINFTHDHKLIMSYLITHEAIRMSQLNEKFLYPPLDVKIYDFFTVTYQRRNIREANQTEINLFLETYDLYSYIDLNLLIWFIDTKSNIFDRWLIHNVHNQNFTFMSSTILTYYFTYRDLNEFKDVYEHLILYTKPYLDIRYPTIFEDETQSSKWIYVQSNNIGIKNIFGLIGICAEQRQYKILRILCQRFIDQNKDVTNDEILYSNDIDFPYTDTFSGSY